MGEWRHIVVWPFWSRDVLTYCSPTAVVQRNSLCYKRSPEDHNSFQNDANLLHATNTFTNFDKLSRTNLEALDHVRLSAAYSNCGRCSEYILQSFPAKDGLLFIEEEWRRSNVASLA